MQTIKSSVNPLGDNLSIKVIILLLLLLLFQVANLSIIS